VTACWWQQLKPCPPWSTRRTCRGVLSTPPWKISGELLLHPQPALQALHAMSCKSLEMACQSLCKAREMRQCAKAQHKGQSHILFSYSSHLSCHEEMSRRVVNAMMPYANDVRRMHSFMSCHQAPEAVCLHALVLQCQTFRSQPCSNLLENVENN